MNQENGVISKTLDEMYQEYIDSLHLVEPQLSDYNLTKELISQIEKAQSGTGQTKDPMVAKVLNKPNELELECERKIQKHIERLKLDKQYVVYIYGSVISLIVVTIVFLISYDFGDEGDIGIFLTMVIFGTPFCVTLIILLMMTTEYLLKRLYVKKYLQKSIEADLNDNLRGIMRLAFLEMNYQNYKAALKEYQDTINNPNIQISWKDVRFKDGGISCYIQIFKRSFDFNIPRSLSKYDNYRLKLMDRFPGLYFKYADGKIILYTDNVNKAIDIIIEYIEDEIHKEREKECLEQERKKREEEERERERREKEKLMNDFYSSHPYFKNEHDTQDALRTKIKVEKSKYLNYLMEHQLDGIDIMSVREDRRTASMMDWQFAEIQNGYVFILKMNAAEYCVIYENVFDNNASIKYINSSLLDCLETAMDIKLHMQSKTPNKRDKIANTRRIGEHRVRRIKHDDFHDWKQKLHSMTFR